MAQSEDGDKKKRPPHAVLVPYRAQGHVNPFMQLGKLLHSRGFHVTLVLADLCNGLPINDAVFDSVKGLKGFRVERLLEGLPPESRDPFGRTCPGPFMELMSKLNEAAENGEAAPVSCIISDCIMTFAITAARVLGIKQVQFWIASACGFMACLQATELQRRGVVPFRDPNFMIDGTLEAPIDWIPGMPNIRLKDMPTYIRIADANDVVFNGLGSEIDNCVNSSTVVINTFDDLESQVLQALATKFSKIFTVGPLPLLYRHMPEPQSELYKPNLTKHDADYLQWLDKREPNSVVYVSYGTTGMMTKDQVMEFAWGLANSRHPFLWVLRPGVVMGESATLPEAFMAEVEDRGLIVSWCLQDRVLTHPAIGVFLTHCGWNSMVEALCGGVPLMCWPFMAEQPTNCRYACGEWGIGMEIEQDVKRQEIERIVKEMIGGDEGRKMRTKASGWKKKAEAATDVGGLCYGSFERFIKEILGA